MSDILFANNASSLLAVSIIAGDLSIQVTASDGALFPSPSGGDYFKVTLVDESGNIEICHCTARSGDLMTVVRAREGTSAQGFTSNVTRVELRVTKETLEALHQTDGDTDLPVASGGTGASTAAGARTNLGAAAASHTHAAATDLTGQVPVANGGTGAANAADARTNLGAAAASHSHAAGDITSDTFADARIAQSNVTQHQAAIDHNALTNYVANRHRLVSVQSGGSPSGGSDGDIILIY